MQADLDLLERWRQGDTHAGEQLFERYFRSLNRFFRNKTPRDAADLAQQTFLACVEGRDRLREGVAFRAYMYAAARRILRRALAREDRGGPAPDLSVSSLHDLGVDLEAVQAGRDDERLLLAGLRRIPLEQQIAIELRFWEGMRGPELAAALEIPEGTVRSRLHRGLSQLRKELEAIEADPTALSSTLTRLDEWVAALRERAGLVGQGA